MIKDHLDKENLHHAYLIEGMREEIVPEIVEFLEDLGVRTSGNADLIHITLDSFKIDDARNLKVYGSEKGFSDDSSSGERGRKVFIISANSILLEAQNSLLKIFEEPIPRTHFFVIVPDMNSLLKTLVSRFFVIKPKGGENKEYEEAESFIRMPLSGRMDFIKNLLSEPEEEHETAVLDSARSKAVRFLNALESALHAKFVENVSNGNSFLLAFEHFFKVREYLRMPGSSSKSLMESVALLTPKF